MNRSGIWEIAAVLFTACAKWGMVDILNLRPYFIVLAVVLWTFLIFSKLKGRPNKLKAIGLGRDGFRSSLVACLALGIPAAIGFGGYAYSQQIDLWQLNILPVLLLYPAWGLLQQLITMNFVAANVRTFSNNKGIVILTTGIAFALVHLPDIPLTLATLALGLFYTWVYLKYENIWPMGILHGWLGALFYYWVMNRDPWAEILAVLA